MNGEVALSRISWLWGWFGETEPPSSDVHLSLLRTLYNKPAGLVLATAIGSIISAVAAFSTGDFLLEAGAAALTATGLARIAAMTFMSRKGGAYPARWLEIVYTSGAAAYALALGLFAAAAIWRGVDVAVQVMILPFVVGYAIATAARDAGRPVIAMMQSALVGLPLALALFAEGSLAYVTLAGCITLALPAVGMIVHTIALSLQDATRAAATNARLAESMKALARTDVVTGLANRAGLDHALGETVEGLGPDDLLALFWLDLDRFKEVNDLLGHTIGDRVLAAVAERLREVAPTGSTICRFGGDEFILLCPVTSRRATEALATRVLANVTRPLRLDAERLEVPASMGIALLPEDGADADALMQRADLALYHAKIGGKNRNRFYDPAMSRNLMRRREIEAELRAAIQRDELAIFFQPIVDLDSGRIRTFEALVRWFHPEKGELMPDEFIPVAEDTGLIVTLGNWITAQAARTAVHWPDDVTLAVNLSPLQIKAPGAALGILSALRDAGLPPSRLELEVTESLFLDDNHATENFINELAAAGVHFALDDFGTGYSSLGYIDRFPFSKIKVDRSFVSGPKVGRKSEAIIRAVAELGAQLGMDIVAEGLETIEQVATVRAAGCSMGQGYYFSRAVPDYIAATLLAHERQPLAARRAG
ncbi:Phytochrome-like protein cph2 [Tsuneonella dongtanensis]|uniref:Phytochrome-like protein cph2 n=1 Tax=Tsuneonella dongtanensis TaxID=692370 RepID=A0A1B2ACG6_9SPHN|nr:EAL domain-containing protein [Tsuneonella dongtanensis]ANY19836.1 Phytochrome-like protein cph2 [Tsuneonella dongtanensis]